VKGQRVVPESPCQRAQGWVAVAGAALARTLQASLSLPPTLQGQGQIQRRLRASETWVAHAQLPIGKAVAIIGACSGTCSQLQLHKARLS
jgi:hypothetical protein